MKLSLNINSELLNRKRISNTEFGSYAVMVNTPEIAKTLYSHYGRRGLALKVFSGMAPQLQISDSVSNPSYGLTSLHHATVIQNLLAREGITPRVYGLASVNGLMAQVTDYIRKTPNMYPKDLKPKLAELDRIFEKYNLKMLSKNLDGGPANWRDGKYIDFSHFEFVDYEAYLLQLDMRARTRRGVVLSKAYQPVVELGIVGSRDVEARIANLNLQAIPFDGASVLDVGCSFGTFSRYAIDAGARRVIGIDKNGQLAFEINNILGYWNLDIITADVREYLPKKKVRFDIVFLMAVQNYIGGIEPALDIVTPVTKNLLIVESHGGESKELYETVFAKYNFSSIEYLGYVEDPMRRHQWILKKTI